MTTKALDPNPTGKPMAIFLIVVFSIVTISFLVGVIWGLTAIAIALARISRAIAGVRMELWLMRHHHFTQPDEPEPGEEWKQA